MTRVFVTRPVPDAGLRLLEAALGADAVFMRQEDSAIPTNALLEHVGGAEAVLCMLSERMDAEVMDAAGTQLKVIANLAVGYDNIDVEAARTRGIHVTNTPDVLTDATADLAWALILSAARRVGEGERFLRADKWQGWGPKQLLGMSIFGKTLGIFGMGRIGQAVAQRAAGFNMDVIYHDANRLSPEVETALQATFVDKETLLASSDVLSIHCPLNPQTRHAFTWTAFEKMKPTAILVNTARGPVVKEEDLCRALEQGLIFAAGLDVYEHEPAVCPGLMHQERAVLLPHLGSATTETRDAMASLAANNIIAALQGRRPPNCLSCCG